MSDVKDSFTIYQLLVIKKKFLTFKLKVNLLSFRVFLYTQFVKFVKTPCCPG